MHDPGTALGQTDAGHLGLGTEAHGLPGCGLCARPPPLERLEAPGHEDVQCRRLPDTIPAADCAMASKPQFAAFCLCIPAQCSTSMDHAVQFLSG